MFGIIRREFKEFVTLCSSFFEKPKKGYLLFLDDLRDPPTNGNWKIARNLQEFKDIISIHGTPEFISFDHDLGIVNGKMERAIDAVKWLIEQEIVITDWDVHSANPVGRDNIHSLLQSWLKFNDGYGN